MQKKDQMKEERKVRLEFQESTLWKAGTFIFAVLFVISLATAGFRGSSETGSADVRVPTQGGTPPAPTAPETVVDVSVDDDPIFGDEDAPVTIVEFSDYECPFCGRFYSQTLPEIKRLYLETGKARLVYRDLPLPFHAMAQKSAEAANCAGEQGKYWDMHDKIFENQATLSLDNLKAWAAQLGVDTATFNSCLDSGKTAAEITKDLADANAAGASGTPTFFINGRKLVGAQPFAAFQAVIEEELAT